MKLKSKLLTAGLIATAVVPLAACGNGCLLYTSVWLEKNGLCGMYGRFGEEYLANVCVQFPRFTEYFGDFKEVGIGCAVSYTHLDVYKRQT